MARNHISTNRTMGFWSLILWAFLSAILVLPIQAQRTISTIGFNYEIDDKIYAGTVSLTIAFEVNGQVKQQHGLNRKKLVFDISDYQQADSKVVFKFKTLQWALPQHDHFELVIDPSLFDVGNALQIANKQTLVLTKAKPMVKLPCKIIGTGDDRLQFGLNIKTKDGIQKAKKDAANNLLVQQSYRVQKLNKQSDSELWQETQKTQNTNAYKNYLKAYPNGQYANEAFNALDDIWWKGAQNLHSHKGYFNYLDLAAKGKHRAAAKEQAALLLWQQVERMNNRIGYNDYLKKMKKYNISNSNISRAQAFLDEHNKIKKDEDIIAEQPIEELEKVDSLTEPIQDDSATIVEPIAANENDELQVQGFFCDPEQIKLIIDGGVPPYVALLEDENGLQHQIDLKVDGSVLFLEKAPLLAKGHIGKFQIFVADANKNTKIKAGKCSIKSNEEKGIPIWMFLAIPLLLLILLLVFKLRKK